MNRKLIITGVALGLSGATLLAQDGSRLKTMDKNGDQKLSQDEVPAALWERISKLDTDSDGSVSMQELAKARPGGPNGAGSGAFFESLDKNGDGKITADEAGERWERMSKADKDGDGGVTKAELAEAMRSMGGAGGGPAGRPDPKEFFARMDKNGDGGITKEEAPEEAWPRLSQADANGDGKVTAEEMRLAQKAREGSSGGAGQTPKRPPVEP